MAFTEPCFGIGHNLSLICQMTSEDIKQQLIITSLSLSGTFSLTASVWYKLIDTDGTTSISRELAPLPKAVSAPCVNPGPLTVCLPPSTPTRLSHSVSPSIHTNTSFSQLSPSLYTNTSSSQLSPSLHINTSSSLSVSLPPHQRVFLTTVSLPPHQHVFLTVCLPPSTPTRLPHSRLTVFLPPHQHVLLTVCLPPSTPTRPPHSLSPSLHTNTSSSQSASLHPHQHVLLTVCLPPSTPTRSPHSWRRHQAIPEDFLELLSARFHLDFNSSPTFW